MSLWAYAYELESVSLVSDEDFDIECLRVDLTIDTGNAKLDAWFKANFVPSTGMWVRNHPGLQRLKEIFVMITEPNYNELLDAPGQSKLLAAELSKELDAFCVKLYDEGHRGHLGASVIGKECSRELWYGFRWALHVPFPARMYRLFNRGHKEEFRFVEWLRGMGHTVEEFDPASRLFYNPPTGTYSLEESYDQHDAIWNDVTGDLTHEERAAGQGVKRKQFRISDVNGHYGGSLDGIITFNGYYASLPKMLVEFKTSGENAFNKMKKVGVRLAKPEHYDQMCSYGARYNLDYALYLCVNKNTDEIHFEIVKLNAQRSDQLTIKASNIINSPVPPPRISENSAYQKCQQCTQAPICHGQQKYDVNCRSCANCQPVEGGQFFCHLFQNVIPPDFIKQGCAQHVEAR